MTDKASYGQILKASSIMGGAAGINMLLGMVRTKFAAVLIGTTGVGLLASFGAVQGLIGTLAGLGIQSSAVRDIAAAVAKNDEQAIGRAVLALRRICWITGLAGLLTMAALSPLISQLTFGSDQYTLDIAALGLIILFANLSGGRMALIQGMRRIGDMARANILGSALGTISTIGFYYWLGLRGIVPALVILAAMQLVIAWHYARRVPVTKVHLTWRQTFSEASGMVRLGVVFMWNGLLLSVVGYVTVTLITQQEGLAAVGIYSAAFALSGLFVNFVLQAMGTDYYPRLTGLAHNPSAMNKLVNEQTEIGLLLAVPGLLATLVLAPWIIQILYTQAFTPAVELLRWFVLGCLGRVISWPLGFVMLALGKSRWFFLTETSFNVFHILLIAVALSIVGLKGVAIAFPILYIGYTLAVLLVGMRLTGFRWTRGTTRMIWASVALFLTCMALLEVLPFVPGMTLGILITAVASVVCLRGLVRLIGQEHRLSRAVCALPGIKWVCER